MNLQCFYNQNKLNKYNFNCFVEASMQNYLELHFSLVGIQQVLYKLDIPNNCFMIVMVILKGSL